MAKKGFKALKYVVSLLLAAALVYLAFGKVEWKVLWNDLLLTRWIWVIVSVLVSVAALVLRAERWRDMMLPLDGSIRRIVVWDSSNVGNLLNAVVPGVGEFARCGGVCTKKSPYDKTLGTIVMERAWDIIAIGLTILLALILKSDQLLPFFRNDIAEPIASRLSFSFWWIVIVCVLVAGGLVAAIIALRHKVHFFRKITHWLKGILIGFAACLKMDRKWRFGIYTVGIWTVYVFVSWFVFKSIPGLEGLDLADALFISAIGNIASVVPVPGGIGAYHYLVALGLSSIYGVGWETGILFATLSHESRTIMLLLLGAASSITISARKKSAVEA